MNKKKKKSVEIKFTLADFQILLTPILAPLSYLYGGLMSLRRRLFKENFETKRICVSVGNISWGGTGKTPIVDWLTQWAVKKDINTCVLTRGYGGSPTHLPLVVDIRLSARQTGDEALLLAFNNPKAHVIVDPLRSRAALLAMHKYNPALFLLDDGFQHTAMSRHLDLVLLHPSDLTSQWNKVQPWGTWRESAFALQYAGAFLIKIQNSEEWPVLKKLAEEKLKKYNRPIFAFMLQAEGLVKVNDERSGLKSAEELAGRPYILVTGVGKPDQVYKTVVDFIGYGPIEHKIYPDHFPFSFTDGVTLGNYHTVIVCTQKDAVKLRYLAVPNLYFIKVSPNFGAALGTNLRFPLWWNDWYTAQSQLDPEAEPIVPLADFSLGVDIWHNIHQSENIPQNPEPKVTEPPIEPSIEENSDFLTVNQESVE